MFSKISFDTKQNQSEKIDIVINKLGELAPHKKKSQYLSIGTKICFDIRGQLRKIIIATALLIEEDFRRSKYY